MTSSDFSELRESLLDLKIQLFFLIHNLFGIQLFLAFYSHNLSQCIQQNVSL